MPPPAPSVVGRASIFFFYIILYTFFFRKLVCIYHAYVCVYIKNAWRYNIIWTVEHNRYIPTATAVTTDTCVVCAIAHGAGASGPCGAQVPQEEKRSAVTTTAGRVCDFGARILFRFRFFFVYEPRRPSIIIEDNLVGRHY